MVYMRAMATFLAQFHDALAAQAQAALIAVVASQPNATVAEIAELLAAYPTLGATTVATMLGGSTVGDAPKRRGRPPGRKSTTSPATPAPRKAKAKAGGGGAKKVNVRTEAGREQFEQDLLAALTEAGGDSVNAATLRAAVGGDPNQVRAGLNRLIERGEVTFSGKARGTRYSLAQGQGRQVRRAGGPGHFIVGS
jgi:hypothetical protein